jgi:predicted alpha/beta hydrolase family esterase
MSPRPVLFVQGAGDMDDPEGSGRLADWLRGELGAGYRVSADPMPDAGDPSYPSWRDELERRLAAVGDRPVLVGHSFGGSVLVQCLAERSARAPFAGLFLVAVPDWGPEGWEDEAVALPDDLAARLPPGPVFLYHSVDDPEVPFAHLALHRRRLPNATVRPVPGRQHSFTDGLPELAADIRSAAG